MKFSGITNLDLTVLASVASLGYCLYACLTLRNRYSQSVLIAFLPLGCLMLSLIASRFSVKIMPWSTLAVLLYFLVVSYLARRR